MAATVDWYQGNPLTHRDRRLSGSSSAWVRSFACEDLRPLIVCRGPIRKEAMDVFEEMGITHYGILLSEKDSIVYPNALAPELRQLTDTSRVHRVPDYTGATVEKAGLKFIGPNSRTQADAGKKDEAKRPALEVGVSVTPGINNVTARTLVKKHPAREKLLALAKAEGIELDAKVQKDAKLS